MSTTYPEFPRDYTLVKITPLYTASGPATPTGAIYTYRPKK